jgi:hypothetical protein
VTLKLLTVTILREMAMKIKTSELTGAALDWAVAKCEDFNDWTAILRIHNGRMTKIIPGDYETSEIYTSYSPSTDWAQGGPIIEREVIDLTNICPGTWRATSVEHWFNGPTPLIAAMRCYVASKLGDEVEVPDELC